MQDFSNASQNNLNSNQLECKVSSLVEWKKKLKEFSIEKGLKKYLKILSFHDLVQESNKLADFISANPIDKKSTKYSRLIINEFKNRIEIESPNLAKSIDDIERPS